MSAISNMNIVVQQGNSAQEMQQGRQNSPENAQLVASQHQAKKEANARSTVQHPGQTTESRLKGDGSGRGRYVLRQKKRKKKKAAEAQAEPTGRLLNTVA